MAQSHNELNKTKAPSSKKRGTKATYTFSVVPTVNPPSFETLRPDSVLEHANHRCQCHDESGSRSSETTEKPMRQLNHDQWTTKASPIQDNVVSGDAFGHWQTPTRVRW